MKDQQAELHILTDHSSHKPTTKDLGEIMTTINLFLNVFAPLTRIMIR